MTRPISRAASATAAAALALLAAGGGGAGAAAPHGAGGPLRDGNWHGTMAVGIGVDLSTGGAGIVASGSGDGEFRLGLAGGTASGDYALFATSTGTIDAGSTSAQATAAGTITGTLEGTATGPILQPGGAHFDVTGNVTVGDVNTPIATGVDLGPDQLVASTMVITRSSCTVAGGTWALEMAEGVAAGGGTVTDFSGSWAATFTGADPGATDSALTDILTRGEAQLDAWFANGTFDAAALEQVLVDAEHYAASAPAGDGCTNGRGDWASPLAGLVERLLTALAHSPSTTAEDLRFGIGAGLRTDVLPSVGETLEAEVMAKADELLEAAVAAGSSADLTLILMSADAMGWTDVAADATAALAALP
jgi:hypothetical protein